MKALVIKEVGVAHVVSDRPLPTVRPDQIRVKVHAVALNPTDFKHIDTMPGLEGCLVGMDFAGVVESVADGELTRSFRVGDRVAGTVNGSNLVQPQDGAFAEYIVGYTGNAIKIPDNLSFGEASTLGVGIITCASGLYYQLKLPLPTSPAKEPLFILIYAGSSATGSLAIQLAKLSGATVITTCSPRNFEFVKSLGADLALDYNSPTVVSDIKDFTRNTLSHVLDCFGGSAGERICYDSFGPSGGKYSSIVFSAETPRPEIDRSMVMAYESYGQYFRKWNMDFPAKPDLYAFTAKFWTLVEPLLANGSLKPHPTREGKGFEGILDGLDDMRAQRYSGEKLVYTL